MAWRFRPVTMNCVSECWLPRNGPLSMQAAAGTPMFETVFATLIPVSFVVFLGYLAGLKSFKVADRALLTKLILNWLLPPLLLGGILTTPRANLLDYKIPLIFLVGLMVPYLTALVVCRYVLPYDENTATLKAGLVAFPDMVFMGIPILSQLFQPSSLYPILIANLSVDADHHSSYHVTSRDGLREDEARWRSHVAGKHSPRVGVNLRFGCP